MILFPNAKINIGLNIIGRRDDGFHDLETVFFPVNIKDALEIIEDETNNDISFTVSGNALDIPNEGNICVKAYHLLKKDFPDLPGIKMHLHKNIPSGAGLGGGSADAAATLLLLNKKFQLNISEDNLLNYASQLGSDCPFFIVNKAAFASGRGEYLSPIKLDLSAYKILVVCPQIHISTADAFAGLDTASFSPAGALKAGMNDDISGWKEKIKNDFEKNIFTQQPEIKKIKEEMYANGAIYSVMSGSGSAVYGIFNKDARVDIKFPPHWFSQIV